MTWKLPTGAAVFAALALLAKRERKRPRRAQRRISHMEQQAKAVADARKRRERLQREAQGRVAERLKNERAARRRPWRGKPTIGERMVGVMEPGKWYGARDIGNLADVHRSDARSTLIQKLMAKGLVERVQNPAWRPYGDGPTACGTPQENMTRDVEPMWLYRLTPLGEAKQLAAAAEAGP